MNKKMLLRIDGSDKIGTGHIMRGISLSQVWRQNGGSIYFVTSEIPCGLKNRIRECTDQIVFLKNESGTRSEAEETVRVAQNLDAEWIVVDGLQFNESYFQIITSADCKAMQLDDTGHLRNYAVDIVINQNLHANSDMYQNAHENTELLLGPKYILFRNEFLRRKNEQYIITKEAQRILVTLGGSDPNNITSKVLQAIKHLNIELDVLVVIGAEYKHEILNTESVPESNTKIRISRNVNNMADLMAWADLAIASGGTTCWELAYMGVPSIVGATSRVEKKLVSGLKKENLFWQFNDFNAATEFDIAKKMNKLIHNFEARKRMSIQSRKLIDGYGRDRIFEAMT